MTEAEFDSKRTALVTLLTQRVGQQNWGLASEVCADLLDIENEWRLSQPLSEPQSGSARYQPVVDEMNARLPKLNSLDMHVELLKAARAAVEALEVQFRDFYQPEGSVPPEWIGAVITLKNAVDRYAEKL